MFFTHICHILFVTQSIVYYFRKKNQKKKEKKTKRSESVHNSEISRFNTNLNDEE
jgi:hypothetical protein